ncbi:MAG: hypothetical protein A2520_04215 [Deltaproteobacteria bacterium RIFOXYD12_FULL_53_23]|nr:MAG: hypothetical protein A2520_04215 [Deltaproteobacteria bacterium RIFOXYD12_FULL_53_23]
MSLLMEALKKSERAKQQQDIQPAQDTHPDPVLEMLTPGEQPSVNTEITSKSPIISADLSAIPELTLMSTAAQDDLPLRAEPACASEIQPPKAAVSDDLKIWVQLDTASNPKTDSSPPPESKSVSQTGAKPHPVQDEAKIDAARQKAKIVLLAKQPANHRKLIITGTVAVVALLISAYGIYVWQSISAPTSALHNNLPPAAIIPAAVPPPPSPEISIPNEEKPPPIASDLAPAVKINKPVHVPAQTKARATRQPRQERPEIETPLGNKSIQIRQSQETNKLNPMLDKAYKSFLSGDLVLAQQHYSQALQQEASNRDALLGLAAIAISRKQSEQAAAYYIRLLDLAPNDPDAFAGLIGLRGQTDLAQSESSLKKILSQNPHAAAIHFALGNVYTQQSRWAEAQQSYFRAYSNAPNNADYAFNLAISLDHLGQSKLALDYYQRALSHSGPANFDRNAAEIRILEIQQPAGN